MFIIQVQREIGVDPSSQVLLVSAIPSNEPKSKRRRKQNVNEPDWKVCRLIGSLPTPEIRDTVKQLLPSNEEQVGLEI
jgi:hypothetical protein